MKKLTCTPLLLGILAMANAHASGLEVSVHHARATGMGTAMIGHVDDASAVLYNPAGLVQPRQFEIQLGDTILIPGFKFEDGTGTTTTDRTPVPPPNAYLAYGINDDVSLGLGVFSLFGLKVPWPNGWEGRFITSRPELVTYYINPELAVRLHPRIRLGAGIQIIRATADLRRNLDLRFLGVEPTARLAGGGWGVGGNAGLMVDVVPNVLSFGATYRSRSTFDIKGKAHFENVPVEFQDTAHDQGAKTTVRLPDMFGFGLGYWPIPALRLAAELDYVGWQSIHDLKIIFDDGSSSYEAKNWTHAWNLRWGGEYSVNEQWRIRAGGIYDPAPTPENTLAPDVPDSDRLNLSAGAGYRISKFNFDLAYMAVLFLGKTSTFAPLPGKYGGIAHIFGVSIGYRI
jgi:long-chain fatty acid transport protein